MEVYKCGTSRPCKFWNILVGKISVFGINGNSEEFMQLFYQTKSQLGFRRRYIHMIFTKNAHISHKLTYFLL